MEFKSDRWRFLSATVVFDNPSKQYVIELRIQVGAQVQAFFMSGREAEDFGDQLKGTAWLAKQRENKTEGQINPDAPAATMEQLNDLLKRKEEVSRKISSAVDGDRLNSATRGSGDTSKGGLQ